MRPDIVQEAVFPDYELADHTGKRRKLSELQGQHPTILVLSRGGFCPKDRRQHDGLVELHRELEVGYCRLVTVSTDSIVETNEFRTGVGAHWTFLSDTRRVIQKDLDIAEYTDPTHNPMIPYTLVLEPGLVIHKIYMGCWFFGRPTMEDLRQDLRAVLEKCRPDWDISTPELKAAWREGRKELFYPYGKSYAQIIGGQDWKVNEGVVHRGAGRADRGPLGARAGVPAAEGGHPPGAGRCRACAGSAFDLTGVLSSAGRDARRGARWGSSPGQSDGRSGGTRGSSGCWPS